MSGILGELERAAEKEHKLLAVLIDPEKFQYEDTKTFLGRLPEAVDFIFVGGSTVDEEVSRRVVTELRQASRLPVVLFPGSYSQLTGLEDALLFLSLLSGRNPEYLIGQQVKAIPRLRKALVEVIPTGYLLLDGGTISAVQRVTGTLPMSQEDIALIVDTAMAGELSGKRLIYLEAGSGASRPVSTRVIKEVKKAITIPLIVGGGIRSLEALKEAYRAGADLVVVGTAFEKGDFLFS